MAHLKGALTFIKRVRTFCIDIKSVTNGTKISERDWMDLLLVDLGLDIADIEEVGVHGITQLLMVTCLTEETFKAKLALLEQGVKWTKMKGLLVYGYSSEEYVTTIKIKNWSNFMGTDAIISVLKGYGDVLTWHKGTVPGYPTVVSNFIVVKMKLKPGVELPALIRNTAYGEILQVLWEGGDRICYRCNLKGHTMAFCKEKPFYGGSEEPAVDSWAAIVAGKAIAARSKKKGKEFPSLAVNSQNKPSKVDKDKRNVSVNNFVSGSGVSNGHGSSAGRPDGSVSGSGLSNGHGSSAGRPDVSVSGSGLPNGHGSSVDRPDGSASGSGLPRGHGSSGGRPDGSASGSGLLKGHESSDGCPDGSGLSNGHESSVGYLGGSESLSNSHDNESSDMFNSQDFIPATNTAKVVKAKVSSAIETSNNFTPLSGKIEEYPTDSDSPAMPLNQLGLGSQIWYEGNGRVESQQSDGSDVEESMDCDSLNSKRGRSTSLDESEVRKSLKKHLKGQKK